MSKFYGLVLLFLMVYMLSTLLFISLVEERLEIYGKIDLIDMSSGALFHPREQGQGERVSVERSDRGGLFTSDNRSAKYKLFKKNFDWDLLHKLGDRKLPRNHILETAKRKHKKNHLNVNISRPMFPSCVNESVYTSRLKYVFVKLTKSIYLYSAFYDARESEPFIRIIAALEKIVSPGTVRLWCHFDRLGEDGDKSDYVTQVSLYQMCENHYRRFGGWILSCPLPKKYAFQGRQPCTVRVTISSPTGSTASSVDMSILTTKRSRETQIDFAVCVPPLFGKIRNEDLVQFVELTRILGANYFVFYVYDVNPRVTPVLSYYESKGIATVLRWAVPSGNKQDIWYYGQSLAINDCLYRHMATVDYLFFSDLDEFLVPHVPHLRSWRDIASATNDPKITCGMTFKSAFFDIALRKNGNYTINNLTVLDVTSRTKYFSGPRNKVMVEPYKVFEVGIHHVSRPWPDVANYSVAEVSTEWAYIHHYRPCDTTFDMDCFVGENDTTIVDRYGDEFYKSYLRTMRNILLKRRHKQRF